MQKKTKARAAALVLVVCAMMPSVMTGCRREEETIVPGVHETGIDMPRTNADIIRESAKGMDTESAEEIWACLDGVEPKCVITEVNTDIEQPDGGRYIYVETASGRRYCINTSTNFKITNITDFDTGERLYARDPL